MSIEVCLARQSQRRSKAGVNLPDQSADKLDIDPALVERYVKEMAQFGKFGETVVNRVVYSPEWVAAMDQYASWCNGAGLEVIRDAVGSLRGVLEGRKSGKVI